MPKKHSLSADCLILEVVRELIRTLSEANITQIKDLHLEPFEIS